MRRMPSRDGPSVASTCWRTVWRGSRGGRQTAAAGHGEADGARRAPVERDGLPVGVVLPLDGARRQHGGAVALEGEGREQAHAVDLGGGHAARRRPGSASAVEVVAEPGALRFEQDGLAGQLGERHALAALPAGGRRGRRGGGSSSNTGSTRRRGASTGRLTTARSSCRAASWGTSEVVVASTTTTWTFGCRSCHLGEQQRDEPASGRADHADPDLTGDVADRGGDVGRERLELGLDAPGPGDDQLAGVGEHARTCGRRGSCPARARGGRRGWTRSTAPCAGPGPRRRSCGGRPRR